MKDKASEFWRRLHIYCGATLTTCNIYVTIVSMQNKYLPFTKNAHASIRLATSLRFVQNNVKYCTDHSHVSCVLLDQFLVRRRLRPSEGQPAASNGPAQCWPTVAIDEAHLLLGRRSACARTLLPPTATSLSQLAVTPRDRPTPTFHARQWAAIADCCSESVVFDC